MVFTIARKSSIEKLFITKPKLTIPLSVEAKAMPEAPKGVIRVSAKIM